MVRLDKGAVNYAVAKATIETALRVLDGFKGKLNDAIKDEKDAQTMYEGMAGTADKLKITDPAFARMAGNIRTIKGQEANHEKMFRQMVSDLEKTERRLNEELELLKEEERNKHQVREPHRGYGKRY